MTILSQQGELAAKARIHTGDANEAGLLVGRVIHRAFRDAQQTQSHEAISASMWRDLDHMLAQRAS
jgi:predicted GNAT family N-acyltransferase